MGHSIKRLLCAVAMLAFAFGALTANADDDVEDVIIVKAPLDPLALYGLGIFFGSGSGASGGPPETGPNTSQTFCHSEEDQDTDACTEEED